jgi:hypothetical protein
MQKITFLQYVLNYFPKLQMSELNLNALLLILTLEILITTRSRCFALEMVEESPDPVCAD